MTTSYVYDDLNELTSSTVSDPQAGTSVTTSYQYDANGNRTFSDEQALGGDTIAVYAYDTSNRLTEVDRNDQTIFTATYDARTRRLTKTEGGTTTQFRYDGGTNFQELDWAYNITKELIRAGGMGGGIGSILYTDETMAPGTPGPWTSFMYDAVGNATVTADSAGVARQETVYDAFGNAIDQSGDSDNNRLRNTGKSKGSGVFDEH